MASIPDINHIIDVDVDEDDSSSSSVNRRSQIYQYFTFKSQRWHYNNCKKNFSDESTSTLWHHITSSHPKLIEKQEKPGEMDKYIGSEKKESVS